MRFLQQASWFSLLFIFTACSGPKTLPEIEYRHGSPLTKDTIGATHEGKETSEKQAFSWAEEKTTPQAGEPEAAPPAQEPVQVIPVSPAETPPFVIVGREDTLFSISQKYQVSGSDIIQWNSLSPPYNVSPGQKIWLQEPSFEAASPAEMTAPADEMPPVAAVPQDDLCDAPVMSSDDKAPAETASASPSTPKDLMEVSSEGDFRQVRIFKSPVAGKRLFQKNGKLLKIHAARGTAVKSAGAGEVIYRGSQNNSLGNLVLIQHQNKLVTVYGHLDTLSVKKGAKVKVGQVIGKVGKTGSATRPQLHFEIRKGVTPLPPANYLM